MTQGIDMGIERRATYDDRGIPEPPSWCSEMIEAKMLTLIAFDADYVLALDAGPDGATVLLRSTEAVRDAEREVSFVIQYAALEQIAAMAKSLLPLAALADVAPLPATCEPVGKIKPLGDFQVFTFVRTDAGAVLYARAVDTRFAARIVFATTDAVARFAVSLLAARDAQRAPKLERLDIPYTTISSKNPIEKPEDLQGAVRLTRTASGRGATGVARVGDAFAGMVPDEILARYDKDGMPTAEFSAQATRSGPPEIHALTWLVVVALVAGAVATIVAKMVF